MRHVIFSIGAVLAASQVLPLQGTFARAASEMSPQGRSRLGGASDLRAKVGELMARTGGPTVDDLLRATALAEAAVRLAPDEPWGYAARCDIAVRWGDARLVETCVRDLRRVAPWHSETKRATVALAALSPSRAGNFGRAVAWGALGLACLLTAGHACLRRLRPSARRAGRTAAALVAASLMLGVVGTAHGADQAAQPVVKFTIDDDDPEAGVPALALQNQAPLEFAYYLQDLIERAVKSTERRDHKAAVRYYRALAKAVPDRSTAWGKLCASYEAAGDPDKALLACRTALGLPGVVAGDYARFVHLLLNKPGELSSSGIDDIKAVVAHLAKEAETRVAAHHLECELGLRLSDIGLLESCTSALVVAAPDDARTISFAWALAIKKGDHDAAARLVDRARVAGVASDGLAQMESTTAQHAPFWRGRLLDWRFLLAVALFVLAGAAAYLVTRRRRESRQSPA